MEKRKKQKDGRYRAKIFAGTYTDDGKPVYCYISAKTLKELDNKKQEVLTRKSMGLLAKETEITLNEYAAAWFKNYKQMRAVNTQKMYKNIIDNHLDYLGFAQITKISKSDIQALINMHEDKPRTCQQLCLTLKQIFKCAVDDGLILKSPVKDIELPRLVKSETQILTDEDIKQIQEAQLTKEERAFIDCLMYTGMRPAEMYALTRQDIDLEAKTITVNKALVFDKTTVKVAYPKTNSSIRVLPISNRLIQSLSAWMRERHSIILFPDARGHYRTKSGYQNIYDRIMKKVTKCIGVYRYSDNHITQYALRHTFCTQCYYAGISLKECQRLMGHSSYRMILEVYAHLDAKKERTEDKINKLFA